MNIWIVKVGEPLDLEGKSYMRNYVLARELVKRGHKVTYFTSGFNHQLKKWIKRVEGAFMSKDGINIEIINGCGYKNNFSFRRYVDYKIIAWKFKRIIEKKTKPNIIIASLPTNDLVVVSADFAEKNKIPLIVDIRDPWPDIIIKRLPFFLRPLLWLDDFKIRKALNKSKAIIGVSLDLLNWGLKKVARNKKENDKVFYLGSRKLIDTNWLDQRFGEFLNSDKLTLGYVGTFGQSADPGTVLKLIKENSEYQIVLIGSGGFKKEMEDKYSSLEDVLFTGWLEPNQIFSVLKRCDAGVCPTATDNHLFPNKVFTYMAAGLPILSAYKGELKEILEKEKIGFYYQKDNVEDLARQIKKLENAQDRQEMSERVTNLFSKHFDSGNIYRAYADHVEKMIKK